jgi:hypothetical protein
MPRVFATVIQFCDSFAESPDARENDAVDLARSAVVSMAPLSES